MNFKNIPTTMHPLGFFLIVFIMLLIGIAMLRYFKWRKWF
jgi:Mg2+ and Co2+ transporter CorA